MVLVTVATTHFTRVITRLSHANTTITYYSDRTIVTTRSTSRHRLFCALSAESCRDWSRTLSPTSMWRTLVLFSLVLSALYRCLLVLFFFFFSSRRRHTRFDCDWSSDVCSSDLVLNSTYFAEDVGSSFFMTSASGTPCHGITIDHASTQRIR